MRRDGGGVCVCVEWVVVMTFFIHFSFTIVIVIYDGWGGGGTKVKKPGG